MGSSGEPKDIDASVGGLVWVRRRNGSWWPGRILGLDEVSEGSLVSPKSGTPVKLLGREDASVDWYNLEKSKRVKAFRCGEYDECIEKARANAATGNKKTVKYARREDAIIHALEIENDWLEKDRIGISLSNNSGGYLVSSAKESPTISCSDKKDTGATKEESNPGHLKEAADFGDLKEDSDSGSGPELSQSGLSFEEPARVRRRTPNDSEDDGSEGIKRMKGLEDLGMVVGDSNPKNGLSNGSPNAGSKGSNSLMKRKRTQVANELLKRKNRSRPLTKVLESTAVVSVPVICDQITNSIDSPLNGLSDGKLPEIESSEARKSVSAVANNSSDSTGVSGENGVSFNASEHCNMKKENDVAGVSDFAETESSDRLFDLRLAGEEKNSKDLSPLVVSPSNSPATHMEKGTSKWQLKGKRNTRHKSKTRKQEKRKDTALDDNKDAHFPGIDDPIEGPGNWGKFFDDRKLNSRVASVDVPLPPERLPLRQSRFIVNSRYKVSDLPARTVTESKLYDVKINVKAYYQPENVPLVSLMSRLNGKAIIGRPLTVEHLVDELAYPPIRGAQGKRVLTNSTRLKRRRLRGKLPRKSGVLSKKTRKLSLLTSCKEDLEKPVAEKAEGSVIACIPLKVVFSRINEALNGSARQMNHGLTSNGS